MYCIYSVGLKKGDRVAIYMPMIIELTVAMLACARLGIVHSIVVRFCRIKIFFWRQLDLPEMKVFL